MCTASGPKLVLTQFIFTLISILLIRINSHYVTKSRRLGFTFTFHFNVIKQLQSFVSVNTSFYGL